MDITLGSLIAGLAALSGWLGKALHAARNPDADETKPASISLLYCIRYEP